MASDSQLPSAMTRKAMVKSTILVMISVRKTLSNPSWENQSQSVYAPAAETRTNPIATTIPTAMLTGDGLLAAGLKICAITAPCYSVVHENSEETDFVS